MACHAVSMSAFCSRRRLPIHCHWHRRGVQVRRPVVMDMTYSKQFERAYVGDAYERLPL